MKIENHIKHKERDEGGKLETVARLTCEMRTSDWKWLIRVEAQQESKLQQNFSLCVYQESNGLISMRNKGRHCGSNSVLWVGLRPYSHEEKDTGPAMLVVKSPSLNPRYQTDAFSASDSSFTVSILVSSRKRLKDTI